MFFLTFYFNFQVTILNGMGVSGTIRDKVILLFSNSYSPEYLKLILPSFIGKFNKEPKFWCYYRGEINSVVNIPALLLSVKMCLHILLLQHENCHYEVTEEFRLDSSFMEK